MAKKRVAVAGTSWDTDPNLMGPFRTSWTNPENGHRYQLDLGYGLTPEGRIVLTELRLVRPEGITATDVHQFPTEREARRGAPNHAELVEQLAAELALDAGARKRLAKASRDRRPGGRPRVSDEHLLRDSAAYKASGWSGLKESCAEDGFTASTAARHLKLAEEMGLVVRPEKPNVEAAKKAIKAKKATGRGKR
jgi:hypothetical protein